jgi:hypothetical protein
MTYGDFEYEIYVLCTGRTYKAQKKPSPLSEEQRLKFAQYLVSRRSVSTPRGAALLLDAAYALADDQVRHAIAHSFY